MIACLFEFLLVTSPRATLATFSMSELESCDILRRSSSGPSSAIGIGAWLCRGLWPVPDIRTWNGNYNWEL